MDKYIKEAIKLAKKGKAYPNPLVGAVLVKNNKIIGRGYHKNFGSPHAEVEAIKKTKGSIAGSTLYVTLEPCCHFGKTPPCTDAIIRKKIKKVVIACKDPNPVVYGKGIKKLRDNNIEVVTGVMEEEARELLYPKKPFVILKMGISLDGKITHPQGNKYITNSKSLDYVHKIRSSVDAILVGYNTYKKDKPELTARIEGSKDPKRYFLPQNMVDLKRFVRDLKKDNVSSILVEGGKKTATSFLNAKLVDKVYLFISPEFFGTGQLEMFAVLNKIVKLYDIYIEKLDDNIMITGYVK